MHGDVLRVSRQAGAPVEARSIPHPPTYTEHWDVNVLMGPHSSPDFFSERYMYDQFLTQKVRFRDVVWMSTVLT
jgi:hypothetical protein